MSAVGALHEPVEISELTTAPQHLHPLTDPFIDAANTASLGPGLYVSSHCIDAYLGYAIRLYQLVNLPLRKRALFQATIAMRHSHTICYRRFEDLASCHVFDTTWMASIATSLALTGRVQRNYVQPRAATVKPT